MTISSQFFQLTVLIASGIIVAAVIDCVRVIKMNLSHQSAFRRWMTLLELVVWALLGVGTYILIFTLKQGNWRGIDPIAQLVGVLLYQLMFQRPIRLLGRITWLFVIKPILLIIYSIYSIILGTFNILVKIINTALGPVFKIFYKCVRTTLKKGLNIKYNKRKH